MRFRTDVELHGKTATGLRVPADVVAALGQGKKPAVRVTVGAHTYRSTVAAYGDDYFLPLSAANRTAAGVAASDTVDVTVELDTAPRTIDVPPDLAAALDAAPGARAAFDALSYSRQRYLVEPIGEAKTPQTRARRVAKAVAAVLD